MATMWKVGVGLALFSALFVCPVGAEWRQSAPIGFSGLCDASGAAALGTNLMAVADDENNQLRIYRTDAGGAPQQVVDVSPFLQLAGKFPETDLEGATWLGDLIFWIGSHSRNREGKSRPNRHVFFATAVRHTASAVALAPVGTCYKKLLRDLKREPMLAPFDLAKASTRAPKTKDALNLEGLCASQAGSLLLGFRNPIPGGRALLVPLLNPRQLLAGRSARFGPPILLDLGGLGIRDLANWEGQVLILAGPYDQDKDFRLYVWSGGTDSPKVISGLDFRQITPEALVVFPQSAAFLVLSDDGTLKVQGIDCKRLTNPAQRRFQAVWVTP
jgi:hypothetical protein